MIKVRIRNFQSIKDSTLEIDGLTAITGSNNSGKSAALRAIRSVFTNAPGHSFVRHGAEKCIVELFFEDGRSIYWEKGPSVRPMYKIDGGNPIYSGKEVPEEIQSFGMAPFQAGGRQVWPQVAPQMTGTVFLLDQPGSVLAEAVSDVDRVGHLNRALKAAETDKRSRVSTLKVRETDAVACESELARFDGLDGVLESVATLEKQSAHAKKLEVALLVVHGLKDRLDGAGEEVTRLEPIASVSVPAESVARSIAYSLGDRDSLLALGSKYKRAALDVDVLAGLGDVRLPGEPAGAKGWLQERGALLALRVSLVDACGRVVSLSGVGSVGDFARFDQIVDSARKAIQARDVVRGLATRLQAGAREVVDVEDTLGRKERDLAMAQTNLDTLLKDHPACPLCGGSL